MLERLRDLWALVGLTVIVLLACNWLLDRFVPEPLNSQRIDRGGARPRRYEADAYADLEHAKAVYLEHEASERLRWEPYAYWRRKPYDGAYIDVDERGHRHTWNPEVAGAPRVFMFGGSTMWSTGVRDDESLPSLVSHTLANAGRPIEAVNFGETGYVSTQEVVALMRELHAGNVPALVVFYDGVNDVFSAYQEAAAGLPQNETGRRREFNLIRDPAHRLLLAFLWKLEGFERLAAWAQGAQSGYAEDLPLRIAEVYAANVRIVQSMADAWGFDALFYWQPVIFTRERLSPHEQRALGWQLAAHRELHLATNQVIGQTMREAGNSNFHDISDVLDDTIDPVYIDFCHLAERGNEIVARRMAADLMAVLPNHG